MTKANTRHTPDTHPPPEPAPTEIRRALGELVDRIGDRRVAAQLDLSRFMLALVVSGAPVPNEAIETVRLGLADGMPDVGPLPSWAK